MSNLLKSLAYSRTVAALIAIIGSVFIWELLSRQVSPLFLPSPLSTFQAAIELWQDGTLVTSIFASLSRISIGWSLGLILGIPLGIVMGSSVIIGRFLEPFIDFLRFIPPIAFITLAIIWLGPGESSKVALIFYATIFIVVVSMIAGVQGVDENRLRAAATMGSSRFHTLLTVTVPSTVPTMVTGARLALGNSFLTVVSAEIVAAQEGVGALIWTARNYGRTDWVFVGIIVLGLLGLCYDRLLRLASNYLLKRYNVSN